MSKTQLISLNIVYTYPVKWKKFQVLRDFVQNFYDSVSPESWNNSFNEDYDEDLFKLTLGVGDVGFSYEWLLHIGASTKTDNEKTNAGFFGEGFKIASLCAMRDFKWGVTMSSRDWSIRVCTTKHDIDGKSVDMLAYELEEKNPGKGTVLELSNISAGDYELFKKVLYGFYYPENPLLGELIWENEEAAVYWRSNLEIPAVLPHTYEYGKDGAIFCAYQMRGTVALPFVFCLHNYQNIDRDRSNINRIEVNNTILEICSMISPLAAVTVLEKMRRCWNAYPDPKGRLDREGFSPIVNELIRRIYFSVTATNLFRDHNPNLLCARRVGTMRERNIRKQARAWASLYMPEHKIVKDTFCLLGYRFLEDECEEHGGFIEGTRFPNGIERKLINLMEALIKDIFGDYFEFENNWPEVIIIVNNTAVMQGEASLIKLKNPYKNKLGLKIRYDLRRISLKESLLVTYGFEKALSTYVHELCHIFGGDASASFSKALTYAMAVLISNSSRVEETGKAWTEIRNEKV